jgi:Na+/phosphate symporter
MWWIVTLLGMIASAACFIGVMVGMFRHDHRLIKRGIIGFILCFLVAFVSVGLAGIYS